jgi:hypothetical protein
VRAASWVAGRTWWLVDKCLRSRRASVLAMIIPIGAAVTMVLAREGAYGIIANAENLIAIGGLPYIAIRAGRRYRQTGQPCQRRSGTALQPRRSRRGRGLHCSTIILHMQAILFAQGVDQCVV